jgi:hypothetical protein
MREKSDLMKRGIYCYSCKRYIGNREIPDLIYLLIMAKSQISLYQRPGQGILKSEKKVIFFCCAGSYLLLVFLPVKKLVILP